MQGGMIGKAQIVAKPDDAGGGGCGSHQGRSTRKARGDIATLSVPVRTTKRYAQARGRFQVNRYVVLYLATLMVLIPIDFLFLGVVAKGFFTAQVGDMLGEIRPAPALLFYLLYVAGF